MNWLLQVEKIMRNIIYSVGEQGVRNGETLVCLNVAPAHTRAKTNATVGNLDRIKPRYTPQINKQRRRRQSKREDRNQTLPTGQRQRIVMRNQQIDGFGKRLRRGIIEGREFQKRFSSIGGRRQWRIRLNCVAPA